MTTFPTAVSVVTPGTLPKPFTVVSLAAHWGCSATFIYSQIDCGALPAWKLGGKLLRILPAEVEAYEQRNTTAAQPKEDSPVIPNDTEGYRHARVIRRRHTA